MAASMPLTARKMRKLLHKEGWTLVKVEGSHYKFDKDGKRLVVPDHGNKALGIGLVNTILKQAGIDKNAVLRKDQKAKRY